MRPHDVRTPRSVFSETVNGSSTLGASASTSSASSVEFIGTIAGLPTISEGARGRGEITQFHHMHYGASWLRNCGTEEVQDQSNISPYHTVIRHHSSGHPWQPRATLRLGGEIEHRSWSRREALPDNIVGFAFR